MMVREFESPQGVSRRILPPPIPPESPRPLSDTTATANNRLKAPGRSTGRASLSRRTEGPAGCQKPAVTRPIFEHAPPPYGRAVLAWRDVPARSLRSLRGLRLAGSRSLRSRERRRGRVERPAPFIPALRLDGQAIPGRWTGWRVLAAGRADDSRRLDGSAPPNTSSQPHASPADSLVRSLRSLTHESLARLGVTPPVGRVTPARAFRSARDAAERSL